MPESPPVLGFRRRDFAKALGVSVPTVERWLRAGAVRHVKIGGTVIIPAAEADRILDVGGDAA
jgi:excisionase family DNA binding protein